MPDNNTLHLIVGLGNPGSKYQRTRHNVGFMVIDELARRHGLKLSGVQSRAYVGKGIIKGVPVLLAQPQTYMNDSGESVSGLLRWHKITPDQLLVVHDELDLPLGTIRIRERGSTAGHNGMKSINAHLRSQEYPRLRVGIDKPPNGDTITWVLGNFGKDEQEELSFVLSHAADAVEAWLTNGIERTMNTYNSAPKSEEPKAERPSRQQEETPPTAAEPPQPRERNRPELPGIGAKIRDLQARIRDDDKK